MPRIGNRVQGRLLVLVNFVLVQRVRVQVLRTMVVADGDVVVDEIQATGLAVTGPQGHLAETVGVVVCLAVDHFTRVLSEFQPLRRVRILGHLVVPCPHRNVLHHDVAFIFHGLRAGGEVHAKRGHFAVGRDPVPHEVELRRHRCELVVVRAKVFVQSIDRHLQLVQGCAETAPAVLLLDLVKGGLAGEAAQEPGVELLDLAADLAQPHVLRVLNPKSEELSQVTLKALRACLRHGRDNGAELLPTMHHLQAVTFLVVANHVVALAIRRQT
mmetsp:Transcript_48943/g.138818  ORF Transcript_48943/g.138818 Transcript_48943/m.138818 type:complete len:271 (+) Transcript_48943:1963-2775(+)